MDRRWSRRRSRGSGSDLGGQPLLVLEDDEDVPHLLGVLSAFGPVLGEIDHLAHALPAVVVLQIGLDVLQLRLLVLPVLGHPGVALRGVLGLELLDGDPGGLDHGGLVGVLFLLAGGQRRLPLLVELLHRAGRLLEQDRRLGRLVVVLHRGRRPQHDGGVVRDGGGAQEDGLAVIDHLRGRGESHHADAVVSTRRSGGESHVGRLLNVTDEGGGVRGSPGVSQ
mmetsp:Transcript_16904/g.39043  ORF Transcript_16904/g.39043 Transcript_16904/m.39043 type:complete len:223 (-) Transcript_16904:183-851(-)